MIIGQESITYHKGDQFIPIAPPAIKVGIVFLFTFYVISFEAVLMSGKMKIIIHTKKCAFVKQVDSEGLN